MYHTVKCRRQLVRMILMGGIVVSRLALAQLPGQWIDPNVFFLLDTGRAMNWIPDGDPGLSQTENARIACNKMNHYDDFTQPKTAWQIMIESLLGSIDIKDTHCFYEAPYTRPYLNVDTITATGMQLDKSDWGDVLSGFTSDYWQYSREPHFRLVQCYDDRDSTGGSDLRGDWSTKYNQCLGADYDVGNGIEFTTPDGETYYCKGDEGADYVVAYKGTPDERVICFDLNPAELDRNADGIFERYSSRARFGLMTFDNLPQNTESEDDDGVWTLPDELDKAFRSNWDYGPDREWFIGTFEEKRPSPRKKWWNVGARGDYPEAVGKLVRLSFNLEHANKEAREVLKAVEPLHCSFDPALFDDFGEYAYNSVEFRPAYASSGGGDLYFNCRPKVVFFITDGIQTQMVEFPQDYCDRRNNVPPPPFPVVDNEIWTTNVTESEYSGGSPTYDCPFNSSAREVEESLHVVQKLAVDHLGSLNEVEPMYLVVIGINMEEKDAVAGRCEGVPTPDYDRGECIPPHEDCIKLGWVDKKGAATCGPSGDQPCLPNCVGNDSSIKRLNFATPRQYLNQLALSGWPETGEHAPYEAFPPLGTGLFRQPPWREDGDLWCDKDVDYNCGGEKNDGWGDGALFVKNSNDLAALMDMVLTSLGGENVGTRTELAVTGATGTATVNDLTGVQQYVFNSGFESRAGTPWRGYLFRQGYQCSQSGAAIDGGAVGSALVSFHDELRLKDPSTRKIFARIPDEDTEFVNLTHYKNGLGTVLAELGDSTVFDDCHVGAPMDACKTRSDLLSATVAYLLGDNTSFDATDRADWPLGDIYNSTPAILPPPREGIPLPSYRVFRGETYEDEKGGTVTNYNRQPYLYVGTNDGILHSFNVWNDNTLNDRVEGWGFVPSPLLGGISRQFPLSLEETYVSGSLTYTVEQTGSYQHRHGVDASPVAADVLLQKNGAADESEWWRSVVIGGLGKGGTGYWALDVTDKPESLPNWRWELGPTEFGQNIGDRAGFETQDDARAALRNMGLGVSKPGLAYVWVNANPMTSGGVTGASEHQMAVAMLPGGYRNTEDAGIETSTGLYIARVADGRILRYLQPDVDADLCDPNSKMFASRLWGDGSSAEDQAKVAQLVGEPLVINGIRSGKVIDESFIGDDRGRIWRVDMSSKEAADWCLEVYFDTLLAEHYPYRDCLNQDSSTPGNKLACCVNKEVALDASTVALPACTATEIADFARDSAYGIDACGGYVCPNQQFPFPRIPMMAPPSVVQDSDRNNVLLFGTGQIDELTTLNHHRVFSLTVEPTISVQEVAGVNQATMSRGAPIINWWLGESLSSVNYPLGSHPASGSITERSLGNLEAQMSTTWVKDTDIAIEGVQELPKFGVGEKLLGRIAVFNEIAYFVTFSPLSQGVVSGTEKDACDGGGSKIWGVSYNQYDATSNTPPFEKLPPESGTGDDVTYYERAGELLSGLKLVRRPSCYGSEGFALMVQKAHPSPGSNTGSDKVDNIAPITSESLFLPTPDRGYTTVGIDSWSIVLGGR